MVEFAVPNLNMADKPTLEQTLSRLHREYGTSGLFLKMSAAAAAPGSYIQLMEHPTRRMASYVLKVNKHFATIFLMMPCVGDDDECKMYEVDKIRVGKFSMAFVSRVLSHEYKCLMLGSSFREIAANAKEFAA